MHLCQERTRLRQLPLNRAATAGARTFFLSVIYRRSRRTLPTMGSHYHRRLHSMSQRLCCAVSNPCPKIVDRLDSVRHVLQRWTTTQELRHYRRRTKLKMTARSSQASPLAPRHWIPLILLVTLLLLRRHVYSASPSNHHWRRHGTCSHSLSEAIGQHAERQV